MRKYLLITIYCVLISSCGGGKSSTLSGPDLDIGELQALLVKQFYANGGLDDDYSGKGQFAIYLRDVNTGKDLACVGSQHGMIRLTEAGIFFANLEIYFQEVDGDHPNKTLEFQLVFVEKDGTDDCPSGIAPDDDIIGVSEKLSFDALLGKLIWATNGKAAALLQQESDQSTTNVNNMEPATSENLFIDKLYFDGDRETKKTYYLYIHRDDNDCSDKIEGMGAVQYAGMLYAALGLTFSTKCIDPAVAGFNDILVSFSLWQETEDGPEKIAETESKKIGDLIGGRIEFDDLDAYLTFASIVTQAFSLPDGKVRLGELTASKLTYLKHNATPSIGGTIEVHFVNSNGGYSVACAGADQNLGNINAPGTYNLNASLAALDGQKVLFGFGAVTLKLYQRTDGLACPKPFSNTPVELATSNSLTAPFLTKNIDLTPEGEAKIQ
ncbi:MAG: hypothetical protein ABIE74_09425 [Pseudomonadota bacterium]